MIELDHAVLNGHLHLWGYEVAIYLFLGGLAAGLLVFAAAVELTGRRETYAPAIRVAALAAPALVAVGLLFLWLDLGSTWSPYWLYTTLRPASPMSWGAWVLLAVLVTSGLAALPFLPHLPARVAAPVERLAARAVAWRRGLATANLGLGIVLGIYTGVLLGTMVARPALNSALLGPLFLASGLSAAVALLLLAAPRGPSAPVLTRAEATVQSAELVLLGLYLIGLWTSWAAARSAAATLTTGAYAWPFWGLAVACGVIAPLAISGWELATHRAPRALVAAASLLTLTGGLALRFVLVYAGQASI